MKNPMTDLILINPSYFPPEKNRNRGQRFIEYIRGGNMYFHPFEPPLGLASLASYLKPKGYECRLIDMPAEELTNKRLKKYLSLLSPPRFIGITAMTTTMRQALEIAQICKSVFPEVPIVMGGVHPTIKPDAALSSHAVDFVIRAEGEEAMAMLMASDMEKRIHEIPGLCFKTPDHRIHIAKKAALISDLDALPLPDYSSFPALAYVRYTQELRGIRAISMLVSRGCPYNCSFCAVHQTMGRRWRIKSPKRVSNEMDEVLKLLDLEGIWFKDSIFNLNRDWVKSFCEYRKMSPLKGKFQINTRVDLVREDDLALMAEAGLVQIDLGIESGSPETLKTLRKAISPKQVRKVIKMAKNYVRISGFFMIGVPGETEEDIDMTLRFAEELELDSASISIFVPLPGSTLYDELASQGKLRGDEDKVHFTEATESYCEVPIQRLRQRFFEFNEKFDFFSMCVI
jgi:radical SAM superfamily enzyme YgiQ (UPF0313 family)